MDESSILQGLNHPNIVEYNDYFDEEGYMCIVLEHMQADLYHFMN